MVPNPKLIWSNSQKLRYLTVGAWNTVAGYGIFAGLYLTFDQHIGYMIIAVLAHIAAVSQSFITHRLIVFRSSQNWHAEYVRFHLAHLGWFCVGISALPIMVEGLHLSPLVAQAAITVVVVIASYFVHQHFTFRKAKDV
ncbi:MAG: GtrA family protein [Azonexus sp.]